jgi:ribulose-phosphate 3-epimerase
LPSRFRFCFSVHYWEGNNNLHRTVQRVKVTGKRVGVVINPAAASVLKNPARRGSGVSATVNSGFDISTSSTTLPKIRRVRQMIDEIGWTWRLMAGIDATTAPLVVDAGANVLSPGRQSLVRRRVIAAMNRCEQQRMRA